MWCALCIIVFLLDLYAMFHFECFYPPLILQEMSVGYANGIRVMSITHTGEPGFMLYIPIEVRVCCGLS